MQSWGFLKNRTMVAALGAVLIFGGGATFAVAQLTHHAAPAGQSSTANGSSTTTTTTGATPTDTTATSAGASAGAGATATAAPTATPIPPTPTTPPPPQPTPTAPTPGQPAQIQGTVTSVNRNAGSFTVRVGSVTFTVVVNTGTKITVNGQAATNLSNLSSGMNANVQGTWQSSSTVTASSVDAQGDN